MNRYGLIGYPLTHSFSKAYFAEKFRRGQISAEYENFEMKELADLHEFMVSKKLDGINITIPHKQSAANQMDELSLIAEQVGAINTVKRVDDKLVGYNTDCFGFREMLKPMLKSHHERALIIGTGGASKAVNYVLNKIGLEVLFVSRNPSGSDQVDYEQLNEILIASHKLIVNTTPIGMFPKIDTSPNIPYEFIADSHLLIDLVYNPEKTVFLKKGEMQGAQIANGIHMLNAQAELSYRIWTEKTDDNF